MVSLKQFQFEVLKKGLEREAFCKKMWNEIKEKREEIRMDVKKYRKKLKKKVKTSG